MNVIRLVVALIVTVIVCATLAAALEPAEGDDHPPHATRPTGAERSPRVGAAAGRTERPQWAPIGRAIEIMQFAAVRQKAELDRQAAEQAAAAQAAAEEAAQAQQAAQQAQHEPTSSANTDTSGYVPDPDATLACIRHHESDTAGGYQAVNPSSHAGGAYQALPSTWDGYGGYQYAEDAPPAVQDQWAHEALAAAGTAPWAGSGC